MRSIPLSGTLALAFLVSSTCLGCGGEREPEPRDRYARRFLPPTGDWMRESAIPAFPQRYPQMVIWEVSDYPPGSKPTPEQQRAADELVERCRAAAAVHGWYDLERGLADGFHTVRGPDGRVLDKTHFRNDEFMLDDRILDCDRPEYLMYYSHSDGMQELAGYMFYVRSTAERGPQIGGPLTVWHFHRWTAQQCWEGVLPVGWALDGQCQKGVGSHRSPEMLHVWLIDRPNGPFSTSMRVAEFLDAEGLHAPFVAPRGDDLEAFETQLGAALARLDEHDRHLLSQALSYLAFAFGRGFTEVGALQPEEGEPADPETRGRRGLLRAAQKRGRSMRLNKYVSLAVELDRVRPELWAEYEAMHGVEATLNHQH